MIKRLMCLLIGLSFPAMSFALSPASIVVSTNSIQVLPERNIQGAIAWVTNTAYSQGALVRNLNSFYFALVGGTSSNDMPGPAFRNTTGSDNDITWWHVGKGERSRFCLVNDSTDKIYVSLGLPAVSGKGIMLIGNGGSLLIENYQGSVFVISTATNSSVTMLDW